MATTHESTTQHCASDDHGTTESSPRSVQGEKVLSQDQAARLKQNEEQPSTAGLKGGKSNHG